MSMLVPLMLMILYNEISGEACNVGFPEAITMGNNVMELDVIPEDTQVLIPSLTITCDGYISHVSIGYKVNPYKSTTGQSVYLQLWRNSVGMRNYTLVEEVLLPPGNPWPGNNNQTILENFELPSRITVRSNDVIGFRIPRSSSVEVLVDTSNPREILECTSHGHNVLNITGIPQIIIRNSKTCHRGLPNNINVSASAKGIVPIRSVLGNIQAIFPSTTFTCNGIINQITGWYQVHVMDDSNNSMVVPATIDLQIWHPISDSQYKLVSETSFPSALDDKPRTVNNLTMQFYSGSVLGVYIKTRSYEYGLRTMTVLKKNDAPQSLLYITDGKPCIFNTASTGVLSIEPIDIEIVLDYDVSNEEMGQIFYCEQDNQISDDKNKATIVIALATSAAVTLIVIVIILILVITCCWRRYKLQKHTESYDDQTALLRSSSHNKSFVSVRYYRLESNVEARPLASASYAVISESTKAVFKNPISDYEQICSELTEVEISSDEIELGDEIGSGNFGVVYHGLWNHSGKEDQVAIKTSHIEASEEKKLKLLREAATIQQFLHTNIIKFYGVIISRERVMIVLEYLPNGSLLDFLRSARPKEDEPVNHLLPQVLLRFAREVGSGMNYLSNKCFIHRDLAARNVLLSEENVCKVFKLKSNN